MPKRKCRFKEDYCKEWPCIKKGRTEEEAYCTLCMTYCTLYICVSHGGRADLLDHIKSNKHKGCLSGSSNCKPISDFFVKKDGKEDTLVTAAELTTAYQVVKHHQSFKSLDCSNKLIASMYSDSKIATKQSLARTKATALIKNVLAPHSVASCSTELKSIPFFGMSTDASNHKAEKVFPLIIQYFKEDEGIRSKLIRVSSLKDETSETITQYCLSSLAEANIPLKKCTSFCGDNTNTNFGGLNRQGQNNIFYKMKIAMNQEIEGIGCPAHILHNTVSCAADVLSIDVEMIVIKLFNFFSIYTIRTETLKTFCDYVDINYKTLLYHSKTRWVSLMPAVERILELWEVLKLYFVNQEKTPKVLADFFKNPLSEAYMGFLHNQLALFNRKIKIIESSTISVIEVKSLLDDTLKSIKDRQESNFIGFKTKQIISKVEDSVKDTFISECQDFLETAYKYLHKWSASFQHLSNFCWMTLHSVPEWNSVEQTLCYLSTKNICFPEADVFEQFVSFKGIVSALLSEEGESQWGTLTASERWITCFQKMKSISHYSHLLKICQYIFSIPAHNANVERIFSIMSSQWTDERNRLSIDTVERILMCHYNYDKTCVDFYNYVKSEPRVLAAAKSSAKYEWLRNTN